MHDYQVVFTRWDSARGLRRQSAPVTIWAADFDAAVTRAKDILHGMAAADRDREYMVASVSHVGLGGEHGYTNAGDIFATRAEVEAEYDLQGSGA